MMNRTAVSTQGHQTQLATIVASLLAMIVAAGCASTQISNRQRLVHEKLPRPAHIWVYDFAATPGDVPANSALAGQYVDHTAPQTAEDVAAGRELGRQIAAELVAQINGMGLAAVQAEPGSQPQINDLVIRGHLLSVQEGSAAKRFAIGFGAGGSELRTAVEGYQMTAGGLRRLGSGTLDSSGSKGPGAALGAATFIATSSPIGLIVGGGMKAYGELSGRSKLEGRAKDTAKEIADVLKERFEEEGWID